MWSQTCSCITENSNFLNWIRLKDITSHSANSICHGLPAATLWPQGLPLVTKQPFWLPISSACQAPLLLASSNYNFDKLMEFCSFCLYKLSLFPPFVFSTIQVLLESMFPGIECSVHADKTFPIPL